MLLESKRLMELAGIAGEETSLLSEGKVDSSHEKDDDDVEECAKDMQEEAEIREAVRSELERMWASGEVFGTKSTRRTGQVTMGFTGVGFKK